MPLPFCAGSTCRCLDFYRTGCCCAFRRPSWPASSLPRCAPFSLLAAAWNFPVRPLPGESCLPARYHRNWSRFVQSPRRSRAAWRLLYSRASARALPEVASIIASATTPAKIERALERLADLESEFLAQSRPPNSAIARRHRIGEQRSAPRTAGVSASTDSPAWRRSRSPGCSPAGRRARRQPQRNRRRADKRETPSPSRPLVRLVPRRSVRGSATRRGRASANIRTTPTSRRRSARAILPARSRSARAQPRTALCGLPPAARFARSQCRLSRPDCSQE